MKRIGILRGGTGEHYATSLKRGGDIIAHIHENLSDKYRPIDILVDREGIWHLGGVPIVPAELTHRVDLVWSTAHPSVSVFLENFSIPHIGIGAFSYTLENSRQMLREHIKKIGVPMPRHIVLSLYQPDFDGARERYAIKKAKEVFEKFSSPWIVRSFTSDPNMGVYLAKTFNELVAAIEDGVQHQTSILVEEFIAGKVASVHSVPHFRNKATYVFPPVDVFGNLSPAEKEKLSTLAKDLHHHIGAKHYLKLNFVLNKRGKVYLLDCELTPNLNSFSHFAQACASVGAKPHLVIEHILEKAIGINV